MITRDYVEFGQLDRAALAAIIRATKRYYPIREQLDWCELAEHLMDGATDLEWCRQMHLEAAMRYAGDRSPVR